MVFAPNFTSRETCSRRPVAADDALEHCYHNRASFHQLLADRRRTGQTGMRVDTPNLVLANVADALNYCGRGKDGIVNQHCLESDLPALPKILEEADHVQVLVTGSMHLVGTCLIVLDPDMNDRQ